MATYSTTAAEELRARLDAVREKEKVQQAVVFLACLVFTALIVVIYCFTIVKQYANELGTLRGFVALAVLILLMIAGVLGLPSIGMRIARRSTDRAKNEYNALAELLKSEPYRSLAEDVRTCRYRFPKGPMDDGEINLEYSSIIARL